MENNMKEFKEVLEWAEDKGLLSSDTESIYRQAIKLFEEYMEYLDLYNKDSIGDMAVVTIILYYKMTGKVIPFKTICYPPNMDNLIFTIVKNIGYNNIIVIDSLEKLLYVLEKICDDRNTALQNVINEVLAVIRNREGKLINGTFVKEGD